MSISDPHPLKRIMWFIISMKLKSQGGGRTNGIVEFILCQYLNLIIVLTSITSNTTTNKPIYNYRCSSNIQPRKVWCNSYVIDNNWFT